MWSNIYEVQQASMRRLGVFVPDGLQPNLPSCRFRANSIPPSPSHTATLILGDGGTLVPGFLENAVKRSSIGMTRSASRSLGQPVVSNAINSGKTEGPAPYNC